ncbi:MAG TPA: hydrogenase iron-sulfur subunit [Gammaproteobacteria bacterium]|nr:hydrogenase iron-sulfur subunit [Gammaproteobacteria bacterium]
MLLVFALWFHVRRLSNVNIHPPRGLAIGSLLALLALSIAKPAISHGPADLTVIPQVLNLDWFYLNIYPLLDYWSAGQVWTLTIGITLLLILLPWLPPRKAGAAAVVDLDNCDGCKQCFEDCPFDAISVQARTDGAPHEHEVVVDPALCAACGICVGSCHSSNPFRKAEKELKTGIDMPQLPVNEMRTMTDAAITALRGDVKILVFGCEHGFNVTQLNSDDTIGLTLFCSGMVPPSFIEYALRKGADGVMIAGCRHADCYFRFGNRWMEQRLNGERAPILRKKVDRRRITIQGGAETDRPIIEQALAKFRQELMEMRESAHDTSRMDELLPGQ